MATRTRTARRSTRRVYSWVYFWIMPDDSLHRSGPFPSREAALDAARREARMCAWLADKRLYTLGGSKMELRLVHQWEKDKPLVEAPKPIKKARRRKKAGVDQQLAVA